MSSRLQLKSRWGQELPPTLQIGPGASKAAKGIYGSSLTYFAGGGFASHLQPSSRTHFILEVKYTVLDTIPFRESIALESHRNYNEIQKPFNGALKQGLAVDDGANRQISERHKNYVF